MKSPTVHDPSVLHEITYRFDQTGHNLIIVKHQVILVQNAGLEGPG